MSGIVTVFAFELIFSINWIKCFGARIFMILLPLVSVKPCSVCDGHLTYFKNLMSPGCVQFAIHCQHHRGLNTCCMSILLFLKGYGFSLGKV